ncbi:MAG: hypothetical protein WAT78_16025 [Rhizobiaceae bacterium]
MMRSNGSGLTARVFRAGEEKPQRDIISREDFDADGAEKAAEPG